jgi:hypothetical protein
MHSKSKMLEVIEELKAAVISGDKGKEYDAISLANSLYGRSIQAIQDCYDEAVEYNGTTSRNAIIMVQVLEEFIATHSCVATYANDFITPDSELNSLVIESIALYNENKMDLATEKIWDAFERLKTFYSPSLDKKNSANKVIQDMSSEDDAFEKMFQAEFKALTDIGNEFRIRHHETTKIDISDKRHYEYFYRRCLALVSAAVTYLGGNSNEV